MFKDYKGIGVENIKWVKVSQESGRLCGESHPQAKLSDDQVEQIRCMKEDQGLSYREIATKMGVKYDTIVSICKYHRRVIPYKLIKRTV